ncbi:TetR/AcrR family transcriptional regulator [Nocardia yunnanensis]|uniref:TetR/AcrR family transcriptional regulator n=1 Tax=Nocardia yunnanensis TaxID=2382165 RepID=A0A386ZIY7_9NOCA|nr:TetR/AcrR family transcriptional regulator [Nocardia yunnanensis]AYF77517.1 TetR/AcrR family transcriptional regulator [Nocardia yunnanensis]
MTEGTGGDAKGSDSPRRRRNPEQTRRAIIEGLLAAVHEGELDPTTRGIAERAGVSERSIFVHFPTRTALITAAVDQQSEQVEALIAEPDPTLPLNRRIDLVVRQSEAIFALQREPRVLGLVESLRTPAVDKRMRLTDKRIRDALARMFTPELTHDPGEHLLDLLDATAGWPYRHHLIDRRNLSKRAASEAIRRALTALLAGPS